MANAPWTVSRFLNGRPYRLELDRRLFEMCSILFLRFLETRRLMSEIRELLAERTDCPADRISALANTLQFRCFVSNRFTDSSFFEGISPIRYWRTERGAERLAELIGQYGDLQEVRVG